MSCFNYGDDKRDKGIDKSFLQTIKNKYDFEDYYVVDDLSCSSQAKWYH